jgi:DNA-binding transcriptional MerR regulator
MVASVLRSTFKIGEVARQSGLPIKTIRYYEEFGLLTPAVVRSQAGYRLFDPDVLVRLAFIKRAQSLGLSLAEIRSILTIHDQGHLPCYSVKHHLQERLTHIAQQIQALETLQSELQSILAQWEDSPEHPNKGICPNLQPEQAV